MNKTNQLLKNIETKEKAIKETLDNATVSDISKEGKTEMIEEIENMISKLENWKTRLQEEIPTKKAS